MNSALVLTIINGILSLVGTKLTSTSIQAIINMLIEAIPVIIKEYKEVLPIVKNIISVLSTSDYITDVQVAQLVELEDTIDANWDSAVTDYLKNHPED